MPVDSGWNSVRAGRPLALQALVALDAAVGRVAGLALLERDLDAVDAAVARVDQLQVVDVAVGERHTVGRVGAGPVGQHREELLLGLGDSGALALPVGRNGGSDSRQQSRFRCFHFNLLLL